jgi:Phosphotransferase enzyme family
VPVRLPSPGSTPDFVLVNAVAARSPEWPHGAVRVRTVAQIGADYGLSDGRVYRIEAESDQGSLSFVLKHESAQATERALRFHRAVGPMATGSIPELLGGAIDDEGNTGALLLEDVSPAAQGDALRGCTDGEAVAAVRSLARVHASNWGWTGRELPRWTPRRLAPDEWSRRVESTAARYPRVVAASLVDALARIPGRLEQAIAALSAGDMSWIHGDAHLDNVLFRPDGSAVLLDWSGAAVGPPPVDLARLLTEGPNAGARAELASQLLRTYADELKAHGVDAGVDDLRMAVSNAIVLLVQSAVAWAAREDRRGPRMRALQENLLRSTLAWSY